jgi:hypothetical protein
MNNSLQNIVKLENGTNSGSDLGANIVNNTNNNDFVKEESPERARDEKGQKLYCVCRRPVLSTEEVFMLQCDICKEWYHGVCVDITEQQAKSIQTYNCPFCKGTQAEFMNQYNQRMRKINALVHLFYFIIFFPKD